MQRVAISIHGSGSVSPGKIGPLSITGPEINDLLYTPELFGKKRLDELFFARDQEGSCNCGLDLDGGGSTRTRNGIGDTARRRNVSTADSRVAGATGVKYTVEPGASDFSLLVGLNNVRRQL